MNWNKSFVSLTVALTCLCTWSVSKAGGQDYQGQEDPNKKILKQGLLGAGVGAISASGSGGNAGKGALIGAGTNVIGGALLDSLSTPSQQQPAQPMQYAPAPQGYAQQQQAYPVQPQGYYQQAPEPAYQPVYYSRPPQEDPNKKILKNGLLGAGTGAIAASASGGKAGKGALIGAGTNVIGGALLDSLMGPSQQQQSPAYYPPPQYAQAAPAYNSSGQNQSKCRQVTYYDKEGNPVKTVEEC